MFNVHIIPIDRHANEKAHEKWTRKNKLNVVGQTSVSHVDLSPQFLKIIIKPPTRGFWNFLKTWRGISLLQILISSPVPRRPWLANYQRSLLSFRLTSYTAFSIIIIIITTLLAWQAQAGGFQKISLTVNGNKAKSRRSFTNNY